MEWCFSLAVCSWCTYYILYYFIIIIITINYISSSSSSNCIMSCINRINSHLALECNVQLIHNAISLLIAVCDNIVKPIH